MKVYLAICLDRHIDPVIEVFDTKQEAIQYAKDFVRDYACHAEQIQESKVNGWLYHCDYSSENDYVYVEEKTVNQLGFAREDK